MTPKITPPGDTAHNPDTGHQNPRDEHDIVHVDLGARGYDIHIGGGVIDRAGELIAPLLHRKRTIVITDTNVAGHWLDPLVASLEGAGIDTDSIILEPGEQSKSFTQLERLTNQLLGKRIERRTVIIALGGGVIGDLVGFAAAVTLRGIDFIQIPTSLLAQVDSSVGGKTGINTPQGKNLVGAFHQPRLVLIDTNTLGTLPIRELRAGYAEVVKYGLIGNAGFFEWLEHNGAGALSGDPQVQRHVIGVSCRAKAAVVAEDEHEHGARALLNFGHTFGHALEAETGYCAKLLHGEAVAIGSVMALRLSERMGLCPEGGAERLRAHLSALGVPNDLSGIAEAGWTADRLLDHMGLDKKVTDGKLTFILARAIGDGFVTSDVDKNDVLAVLNAALD